MTADNRKLASISGRADSDYYTVWEEKISFLMNLYMRRYRGGAMAEALFIHPGRSQEFDATRLLSTSKNSNGVRENIYVVRITGQAFPVLIDHARCTDSVQIVHVNVVGTLDAENGLLASFPIACVGAS